MVFPEIDLTVPTGRAKEEACAESCCALVVSAAQETAALLALRLSRIAAIERICLGAGPSPNSIFKYLIPLFAFSDLRAIGWANSHTTRAHVSHQGLDVTRGKYRFTEALCASQMPMANLSRENPKAISGGSVWESNGQFP